LTTKITFALIEGQHYIAEIELGEEHAMDKMGEVVTIYPIVQDYSFEEFEMDEEPQISH
jgi:hypothetical protein